jgi:ribosomal protein S18 acetylase RimI-like enzyme
MTSSEPLIRRAGASDGDALGRLGALLVQQHHSFDERRFLAPTPDTPERYGAFLASQLDAPDAVILVAEHEGRVIGYAYGTLEGHDYLSLRGPAALLHDLIVDPDHRGRGAGRMLLNAILGVFSARRAPRVVLSTGERNAAAQRFFERESFRRTMVEMTRELDQ